MPRPKNNNETVSITLSVSQQTLEFLQELEKVGYKGNTPTTIATYLLQERIGQLIESEYLEKAYKIKERRSK